MPSRTHWDQARGTRTNLARYAQVVGSHFNRGLLELAEQWNWSIQFTRFAQVYRIPA
jgi:hypothetical protein